MSNHPSWIRADKPHDYGLVTPLTIESEAEFAAGNNLALALLVTIGDGAAPNSAIDVRSQNIVNDRRWATRNLVEGRKFRGTLWLAPAEPGGPERWVDFASSRYSTRLVVFDGQAVRGVVWGREGIARTLKATKVFSGEEEAGPGGQDFFGILSAVQSTFNATTKGIVDGSMEIVGFTAPHRLIKKFGAATVAHAEAEKEVAGAKADAPRYVSLRQDQLKLAA